MLKELNAILEYEEKTLIIFSSLSPPKVNQALFSLFNDSKSIKIIPAPTVGLFDDGLLCFLLDPIIDPEGTRLTIDANSSLFATADSEGPAVLVEAKPTIVKIRRPIRIKELLQMVLLYVKDHPLLAKKREEIGETQYLQKGEPQAYSLNILVAEDDMLSRQVSLL